MDFTTSGNCGVATTVAAGVNINHWDWNAYCELMQGKQNIACPVCGKHKSKDQITCSVCFQNILDSRNGAYPDRWSKA